jgi:2-polyprenyl-3-methyl-5-hydroxy-6-metoxy-1,4-benzoquinol methylase
MPKKPISKSIVPCPICEATSRKELIVLEQWRIEKCRQCSIGILDPMPEKQELKRFYNRAYFEDQYDDGLEPGTEAFQRRISQEDHRLRMFRRIKKSGALLDLGCGLGYFLYACRRAGYQVQGADLSVSLAEYVEKRLQIPMIVAELEELDFPTASFDIITMWHFLEHTRNPSLCIQRVGRWLKPDGVMVIDVPNYESTDATKYWADWVGWQVPFHLYHFSPRALEYLLSKHHLKIIRRNDYHSEFVKERLKRIPLVNLFARNIAKFYSGTSIAVTAVRD